MPVRRVVQPVPSKCNTVPSSPAANRSWGLRPHPAPRPVGPSPPPPAPPVVAPNGPEGADRPDVAVGEAERVIEVDLTVDLRDLDAGGGEAEHRARLGDGEGGAVVRAPARIRGVGS